MWIGIFYGHSSLWHYSGGRRWIPAIINSFHILGQNASSVGPLARAPSLAWREYVRRSSLFPKGADFLTGFASSMALVFCAVIIFIAYLAIAIQSCGNGESYLVIGAGVIFLGFGVAVDCGLCGALYRLRRIGRHENLVLYLLVGAGMTVSQGWMQVAQTAVRRATPARTGFDLAAAAVMFLCVCWMVPKISSAMQGVLPRMSGRDLTGVGMGVGLAAVGAGVVADTICNGADLRLCRE